MRAVTAISHASIAQIPGHVTICLTHGVELSPHLPPAPQDVLARVVATRHVDLEADLTTFAKITKAGRHVGTGVLGNAAEFLLSQSGIFHEEAPCSNRVPQKK